MAKMTHTVTLTIPDRLYSPIERLAKSANQSVETMLLNTLQSSLPALDRLPPDLAQELSRLEMLDNDRLRLVMAECVPTQQQVQIEALLAKHQAGTLSEEERGRLDHLQHEADKVMLRKARAAVLLRFRGQRLPTLAELSFLDDCA